jgi:excisionase family DNA binding protein
MTDTPALLDIPQAAQRLGLSQSLIRRYCRQGRLGFKLGSRWVIPLDHIEQFVKEPRPAGRPKSKPSN